MDTKLELTVKFPKEKVVAALREWWESEKISEGSLRASPPATGATTSVLTPIIEIDSHRAVNALLTIEKALGIEISESNIKEGGYGSIAELIAHLVPRAEIAFDKKAKS